jgi:hypothetical protein
MNPIARSNLLVVRALRWAFSQHLVGSLFIVVFATWVIAAQVENRVDFANSELMAQVEDRWGAPVHQPAPSLRAVQSGTVFTDLAPLAFDQQHVQVDAQINYRKRGLRYFSGFDFTLDARYAVKNPKPHDIDVAFIFPIEVDKTQVLLSDLTFTVNGEPRDLDLGETRNRLLWTGRIREGEKAEFGIRYRARGLNSFTYRLDPALPARNVKLHVGVRGGNNFDYPADVLSASTVVQTEGGFALDWAYPSLESGVSLGVVLPSEKSFDALVATMARRAWVPFLAFAVLIAALGLRHERRPTFYEMYLLSAAYGFAFVLLAYLAAFLNFYAAYVVTVTVLGAVVGLYTHRLFPREKPWMLGALWMATFVVPCTAVILDGYTGLIYTLEILGALLGLMVLSTRRKVRDLLQSAEAPAV